MANSTTTTSDIVRPTPRSPWQDSLEQLPASLHGLFPLYYTACAEADLGIDLRQFFDQCSQRQLLPETALNFTREVLVPQRPLLARDFVQMRQELRQRISKISGLTMHSSLQDVAAAISNGEAAQTLDQVQELLGLVGEEAPIELFLDAQIRDTASAQAPKVEADLGPMKRWLQTARESRRKWMHQQLEHPRFRSDLGLSTPAFRERIYAWVLELASQGLGKMPFPTELGGQGDLEGFLTCMETMATFDLSLVIKFGVNFGLFGNSIFHLGTGYHHEKFLQPLLECTVGGCFAMTETGHGSNVRGLATTARYDRQNDEFVIHTPHPSARKDYIGNAALHARLATVFAQLIIDSEQYGVHAFVVPIRDEHHHPMPGVFIEDCGEKIGLNGVDNGRLRFTQVRIPRENMLDCFAQVSREGLYTSSIANPTKRFFTMISTLVTGRATLAGAALGVSKVALTNAIIYSSQRRQFGEEGRPENVVLDYQTHQKRLIPRLAATLALECSIRKVYPMCSAALKDSEVRARLDNLASGLKAWSTWHAMETVQLCRECCGGQGYLAINRFGQLKADLDVFTTFEGDNTVLMQQVSKGLLTNYKHQFSELRFFGLMKHFTSQAAASVIDWNPFVTRNTDQDHLRDAEFYKKALRTRESHLLSSLAKRLRHKVESGSKPWEAATSCQDHMVQLGRAHIERVLLENFSEALAKAEPGVQDALKLMHDIFALSILERERGWFLENGYFEGPKSKAIRNLLLELCRDAKLDSIDWVNAFDLPSVSLSAPIARHDYPIPPVPTAASESGLAVSSRA
jgi:acyl-CoA oxidase